MTPRRVTKASLLRDYARIVASLTKLGATDEDWQKANEEVDRLLQKEARSGAGKKNC